MPVRTSKSLPFTLASRSVRASLAIALAYIASIGLARVRESFGSAAVRADQAADWPWSNADLELAGRSDDRPAGWQYPRQARRVPRVDLTGAENGHCLYFHNDVPGRLSQLQQTMFPPENVRAVRISAEVRLACTTPGQTSGQRPHLFAVFESASQKRLATASLGPWLGTSLWTRHERMVEIPPGTHAVKVWIGLAGGVGEAWFDNIELQPVELNRSVLTPD